MATSDGISDLFSAVERIELALAQLETAVARQQAAAPAPATQGALAAQDDTEAKVELAELKTRHRRLRERVTEELQQLDLLLSSLPQ